MPLQQLSEVSIFYEMTDFTRAGERDRPALLFVHGLNSSHRHWLNQVPVFARRHAVITVDLRGHGQSSAPPEGYSVHHHTDDLAGLLDALEVGEVVVIGASLGGCMAQQLAVRTPQRVKAIVAVGSCAQTPKELDLNALLPAVEQMGIENFLREFLPGATFCPDVAPGLVEFALDIALESKPEIILQRTKEGLVYGGVETARKIACPALILLGENDNTTPRYCSEELKELIRGSEFGVIPGCGHLPHLEAPEVFNEILSRFLDRQPWKAEGA
jgi:pimeloyl-ACP methyl ester carboxylesterase